MSSGLADDIYLIPADTTPPPGAVQIVEHGELGPLLVDPEHDFTGPKDVDD